MGRSLTSATRLSNNGRMLGSEYASYNADIREYFEVILNEKRAVMLDPMAGTAPLIPAVELGGHKAYFNDILPLHHFVNQSKTYEMYLQYRTRGRAWYYKQLDDRLGGLQDKKLCISEEWIDGEVLEELVKAWDSIKDMGERDRVILRASLLLSIKGLACLTKTKNPTWWKRGGVSSGKNVSEIVAGSIFKVEEYYLQNYCGKRKTPGGTCVFSNGSAMTLRVPEKVDLILTSPPYCNRYDINANYGPENYFMAAVGYPLDENSLIGTVKVKGYESFGEDLDFLTRRSRSARKLLNVMMTSGERDENSYYAKYYTRYFVELWRSFEATLRNLAEHGEMFLVTQDNVHRGQLIQIDKIISELLRVDGWQSRLIRKWERRHLGLQNVSRKSVLVIPRQLEKITKVWR